MEQYNLGNVFTHTINVYSSLLRPSRIDNGSLRYEACNEWFNMLSKLVHTCNDDELHMNQKMKEKLQLLWDIQKNLNAVYTELKEILSKKKGDFRSAIGGRLNFTERSVIRQDVTLKADQIKLPFHGLCELLQQVIINILVKSYQFSYAEAYKKWYKAQITGNDKVVFDIIEGLIHDADGGGLPIIINRNPKIVGDIVETQCR
jgi:DNA-directed RNA polymerase beta' subunit